MIEVTWDGRRMTFTGHAGYAPAGQDIVCAAVSALYAALALTPGVTAAGAALTAEGAQGRAVAQAVWRAVNALAQQYGGHIRPRPL